MWTSVTFTLYGRGLSANANILQQVDGPVAYPSLLAHRLLHHLAHPLLALLTPIELSNDIDLKSSFNSLRSDLPSDIFMVTLRSVEDKQRPRPSGEALLVLHREGYDCNFECKGIGRTSRGQVSSWWWDYDFTNRVVFGDVWYDFTLIPAPKPNESNQSIIKW